MSARQFIGSSCVVAVLAALSACTSVDVKEAVALADITSGWFDAGIVDGKNKIVASVSFRLRKLPEANLDGVALNVIFRHPPAEGEDTEAEWDEVYVQNAEFREGDETQMLVLRTEKGYTGEPPQSRLDLLQHSQFRDLRARVFARYGSAQWVEIGTIDVERQLLTR